MASFYQNALCLCNTSDYEGFPNTSFWKAWSHGLGFPIVSMFDPDSPAGGSEHWASKLPDAASMGAHHSCTDRRSIKWAEISRNGRHYFNENHRVENVLPRFKAVFAEVAARQNRSPKAPWNFLVTGGAGFIGSHLCERLLTEGHAVWTLDDLNDFYSLRIKERNLADIKALGRPFTFIRGDITDAPTVENLFGQIKFDQVIHLAARAGVRPSLEQPALYQRVNVEGTVNLLEAARKHGVKKMTIASSSSVYGVNAKVPFAETDPIFSAISPYAASKLACEALGHVYHHIYGMDIAMLRFFTVYGPRQRPDLAIHKFARLIEAGKPIPVFGDGSTARDYTFVSDTLDGIMACTRKEIGFEIFNLGESQTVTLASLIELLEKAVGKKAVIDRQSAAPGDVPITYADISKAQKGLGYHPSVKIEQGIPKFVEWFRQSRERI